MKMTSVAIVTWLKIRNKKKSVVLEKENACFNLNLEPFFVAFCGKQAKVYINFIKHFCQH